MIITVNSAQSLTSALNSAKSGDTILLEAGNYSNVQIRGVAFNGGVTIASKDPGNPATLTGLVVNNSQGLSFQNLHLDFSSPWTVWNAQIVNSKNIEFNNFDIHGSLNNNPADDRSALLISNSTGVKITGSQFHELAHGVSMMNSNDVRIEGNTFREIRSDGVMSAGTSHVQVVGNTFTNFYPATGDHPDAIQFLTRGTTSQAHDILVSGNLITRGDGGIIQGVFITDQVGLGYERVTVSDNVVIGGMYNGIMVARANNLVINGNIVASYGDQKSWIRVTDSSHAQMMDNQAQTYVLEGNSNLVTKGDAVLQPLSASIIANLSKWLAGVSGDKATMELVGGIDDYQLQYLSHGRVEIISAWGHGETSGVGYLHFADGQISLRGAGDLIDPIYYAKQYKDVFAAGGGAGDHYALYGWSEGRDPNAWFSTDAYLKSNQDVAKAQVNPLLHYELYGWREGRDPSQFFDNEFYLARNPDVAAAGLNPLAHYIQYGQAEGRVTFSAIGKNLMANSFDADAYQLANSDVAAAGGNAYAHWSSHGWREGRNPNAVFDTKTYLAANSDVRASGKDPLEHYNAYGWREGRDPSASFDTSRYLEANPDVAAAGVNPLWHYLTYGASEGRAAYASDAFAGVKLTGTTSSSDDLFG